MKENFYHWKPNKSSVERLEKIGALIEEYRKDEITMTLRQLFYRLVAANVVPNTQREYKNLGELLSKARLAGIVDWESIEDRVRRAVEWQEYDTIGECASAAARTFALPRWQDQPVYIELWCEKDALSSVLRPICDELFCTFMVNRGYSSTSAMYEARNRIERKRVDENGEVREVKIIYLGDFDPSGEDMVRDITERLGQFRVEDVEVIKLALNPDQIKKWKLPPNPLKSDHRGRLTDSRGEGFRDQYGDKSYEVDAIPPRDLQKMVRSAITREMDMDLYNDMLERERILRNKLIVAASKIK